MSQSFNIFSSYHFITLSIAGFLVLKVSKPRAAASIKPKNFDLFFTSMFASTNSSMSMIEMEIFSNFQLFVMTILMLEGGSWLELHITSKFSKTRAGSDNNISIDQIELGVVSSLSFENGMPNVSLENGDIKSSSHDSLRQNSVKILCYIILGYL
ncbi:hypothetical protein Pint_12208 [Pistacia integerrima]|uniref:Uncharacterized protein n=1 Tax=Pistacia integerrima TaxID=434235 RepID=A0ACC0XMG5_9ROSI|nr:hypothetical protein Pint_12208 [Pistacia integerrima]